MEAMTSQQVMPALCVRPDEQGHARPTRNPHPTRGQTRRDAASTRLEPHGTSGVARAITTGTATAPPPTRTAALALALTLIALLLPACKSPNVKTQASPYPNRVTFAVAPLRNESGSRQADGLRMADQLARQFELVQGVSVLPVNRAIEAMAALGLPTLTTADDAIRLREALDVDALVAGSITAYEPYDPPKLGLALDLYVDHRRQPGGAELTDLRKLVGAAVDEMSTPMNMPDTRRQPVSTVSGYYDAAAPDVRAQLQSYAKKRGQVDPDLADWHLHRLSIDLYSEFVTRLMSRKLLQAERLRLTGTLSDPDDDPDARANPTLRQANRP